MDDAAWLGAASVDVFTQSVEEDAVSYQIFLLPASNNTQRITRLREVRKSISNLERQLIKDYVWHRERFSVELIGPAPFPHLSGETTFGDSLADEWTIVYILRELSLTHPDCWIRAHDQDGEFLLVEAANALPQWLEPDVASCRVWMNHGRLLLLPPSLENPRDSSAPPGEIDLETALSFITAHAADVLHLPEVQAEAFSRLKSYPQQLQASTHIGAAMLPRKLAYIIHHAPATISSAVWAFQKRDRSHARTLENVDWYHFPPADLVRMAIRFNRTSFAQLKSEDLSLPNEWNQVEHIKSQKTLNELDLGLKVIAGYELLMRDSTLQSSRAGLEVQVLLNDIEEDGSTLPSNEEIAQWPQREESEDWLDVNYEDFERELSGVSSSNLQPSFIDTNAEDSLRRVIAGFEKLMDHDDDDHAQLKDFLSDDDVEGSGGSHDESADDEPTIPRLDRAGEHTSLMNVRQPQETAKDSSRPDAGAEVPPIEEIDRDEDEPTIEEVQQMLHEMQAELQHEGVLDGNDPNALQNALAQHDGDDGEGTDARHLLARNFLASLKG
ncbi:MAG: hypothetical protein Q9162_007847 [Coniocarpon cinnabarinum]